MKNTFLFIAMISLLASFTVAQDTAEDSDSSMPSVSMTGPDSQVQETRYERVVSLDQWVSVWREHLGKETDREYDFFYDPLSIPLVDFENHMVIVVFVGSSWNSAGLTAVSVTETDDQILFRYRDKPYQTAGINGGGQKVTPFGFFVVPRSTKALLLEEEKLQMQPPRQAKKKPQWRKRHQFTAIQAVQ